MAVRGDDVASSIDAQVRQSVEKLVGEIRSSIEDVRTAVDQQLNAALQSIQADVKSITFLPEIQKSIGELKESMTAAAPPKAVGGDATHLKTAIQNVERGKSQVDILNALLEQCLTFGSRAALLILRGETFSGWKGLGFSMAGGNDETIKRFNAAPGLIPELDRVLREEHVVAWDGANLSSRFGVPPSTRALLVPMVIKDKVAAAIYVDAVAADVAKLDRPTIEILVFATGLLVDTLAIRKKIPSPTLSQGGATAAAPTPAAAPRPTPAPAPAPAAAAPRTSETVAFSAAQMRDMMAAQQAPAAPKPAPQPAAKSGPVSALGGEGKPSTQFVPPAGAARAGAMGGGSEESKKHDEARRFARLLVSEIKLYNEAKVDQGRKGRDLYERMKDDIDRSRQMYDERISEDVRKSSNYFYDELVRILADGKAELLGL
jgi:hypothetical protein